MAIVPASDHEAARSGVMENIRKMRPVTRFVCISSLIVTHLVLFQFVEERRVMFEKESVLGLQVRILLLDALEDLESLKQKCTNISYGGRLLHCSSLVRSRILSRTSE